MRQRFLTPLFYPIALTLIVLTLCASAIIQNHKMAQQPPEQVCLVGTADDGVKTWRYFDRTFSQVIIFNSKGQIYLNGKLATP